MISIIITSYKEPETIGKAITSVLSNKIKQKYEIIVCAPDKETLNAASVVKKKSRNLKLIKDHGKGKSAALNLAVSKAKGDILILTDGDVFVEGKSLNQLIEYFKDENIGAVTGRPISTNNKGTMLGFWAYMLTEVADEVRRIAQHKNKRFFCSGYLFAIRKRLFPKLPENLLSEDGYISHMIYESGHRIAYSPTSKVYVKYPDNFNDWIIQKKRSAGGYNQIKKAIGADIRSFTWESSGAFMFFKFIKQIKHFIWLSELFLARIYLWLVIYRDINLKNKSHKQIWKRVESTK